MYRIRFHGRGGHGMKTASRMLGTAFLLEGFEVQDAPRYGAERRGAPISAYVRAQKAPIHERGVIRKPDLVVVADDTLVAVPAAGVMQGVDEETVLLIDTDESADEWRRRLNLPAEVLALPAPELAERAELPFVGAACAGAAARLTGVISAASLEEAVATELALMDVATIESNLEKARDGFARMAAHEGVVRQGGSISAEDYAAPEWVALGLESAERSAPSIPAGLTSTKVRTGLWRVMRPVIDTEHCKRCIWVCGSFCPDGVISAGEDGYPVIDLEHCKGCMICAAQCPPHAIRAVPEAAAQKAEGEG
jgi:pyruvate ferredoxin oxidoreductase gamma subunit